MLTTEQNPTKPKFFLHDEVKAWLKDNLVIDVTLTGSLSTEYRLVNMGIYSLPTEYTIHTSAKIAGDELSGDVHTMHLDLKPYQDALVQIVNHYNGMVTKILDLHEQNTELRRRIEMLENPLPV